MLELAHTLDQQAACAHDLGPTALLLGRRDLLVRLRQDGLHIM
jgi:hypothetical protein